MSASGAPPRLFEQGAVPQVRSAPRHQELTMNPRNTATRITCLFAAALMTALIVGGQLGIASNYTAEADALLAARHSTAVAQNADAAAPQTPGI
jgi:hypothetical protein